MTVSLNTNLNALRALRRLDGATSTRSLCFERLSTGARINRASDDAAGLAASSSLNAAARINSQAVRNVSDAVSYLHIADGAMGELKSILIRLRELSTQSSNGSLSNTQRQSLDVAGETARLLASTILQQAASTVLAHALKGPALTLKLLMA